MMSASGRLTWLLAGGVVFLAALAVLLLLNLSEGSKVPSAAGSLDARTTLPPTSTREMAVATAPTATPTRPDVPTAAEQRTPLTTPTVSMPSASPPPTLALPSQSGPPATAAATAVATGPPQTPVPSPRPANSPTATPTSTTVVIAVPTSTPIVIPPLISGFQWFVMANSGQPDSGKPIPPNSPSGRGFCVTWHSQGSTAQAQYTTRFYVDGMVWTENTAQTAMTAGDWQACALGGPLVRATLRFELYLNGVIIAQTSVVSG